MLPRFEGDSNCVHGGGDNWVLPKSKRNLEIHVAKKKNLEVTKPLSRQIGQSL